MPFYDDEPLYDGHLIHGRYGPLYDGGQPPRDAKQRGGGGPVWTYLSLSINKAKCSVNSYCSLTL